MFPKPPLQPNEFQAQLRQAATDVIERARASKVQLPENFNLGFDEYATSLPNSAAAPRLGRQLRAIEWIANTIVDAHVDSLQSLTRSTLPEEKTTPAPTSARTRGRQGTEDCGSQRQDRRLDLDRCRVFRQPGRGPAHLEPDRGGERASLHYPDAAGAKSG